MTNHEDCGSEYRHVPHVWLEFDGQDRIQHWCDGEPESDQVDEDYPREGIEDGY